jgi:methyl-accepting chemotaxis protein
MLHEGNVLACIQLVDEVSIATSVNFTIHILSDPNDGSDYELSDDYSDFQKMIIRISCLEKQMKDQMESQKIEFEDMQLAFQKIVATAVDAEAIAREAKEKAEEALGVTRGYEDALREIQETVDGLKDFTDDIERAKQEAKSYTDDALTILEF